MQEKGIHADPPAYARLSSTYPVSMFRSCATGVIVLMGRQ